jgi:hypothetical protein
MLSGEDGARLFTDTDRAACPRLDLTDLAYWELVAALRPAGTMRGWGLADQTRRQYQRRHRAFVDRVLPRLAEG